MSEPHDRETELRATIDRLRPKVDAQQERSSARAKRARERSGELLFQALAQTIGTLLAAAVLYMLALLAGALEGTTPVTIVASASLIAGAAWSLFNARWLVLPSKRAEAQLMDASVKLAALTVRSKLKNGEPLSVQEARLVSLGLVNLEGLAEAPKSRQQEH